VGVVQPHPGVITRIIDDTLVLFSEPRQETHTLDGVAGYLWCLLEGQEGPGEMADKLAAATGQPLHQAKKTVEKCLRNWSRHGFLDDAAGAAVSETVLPLVATVHRKGSTAAPRPPADWICLHTVEIAGQAVELRFDDVAIEDCIMPLFDHLATASGAASERAPLRLDISSHGTRYDIFCNADCVAQCHRLDELAPSTERALTQLLLDVLGHEMVLPAAAVLRDGEATVVPAKSGVQRTALTAAHIGAGYGYLCDGNLLYDGRSGVRGLGLCLAIEPGSLAGLASRYPSLADVREHIGPDLKRVRYLPPPASSLSEPRRQPNKWWPVGTIVLPKHRTGRGPELRDACRTDALEQLMGEAYFPDHLLSKRQFSMLAGLLNAVACKELIYDDPDQAAEVLRLL